MGTNYYAQVPTHEGACEHCGRADRAHICKSLVSFQGYDDHGPFGEIRTWADWKRVLRETPDLTVWNEYGVEYGVEEFIGLVEATDPARRRRQYDWILAHPEWMGVQRDMSRDWLDPDGFSFTIADFT